MAPALSVLLSSVAVAAAAPSGGKKMVTKAMRPRGRTLKAEAIGRVKKFNDHASRLTGKTFSSVASTKAAEASSTSPNREMQSYWDYPMTLDYVVDIAVAANSSAKYSEYQVIVDTGSSNLAISLESCSCGEGSSDLDVSIDEDECIEVTYGSGAWSGYETATLSVLDALNLLGGCLGKDCVGRVVACLACGRTTASAASTRCCSRARRARGSRPPPR